MTDKERFYGDKFYENQAEKSYISAKAMLTKLLDYIQPESVVDVGCGVGTWLAAAEELEIQRLKGFDGEWVLSQSLQTEKMDFTPIDF